MSQPVTFYGHGLAFHPTKNRVLCRFVDGKYQTRDAEEIAILSRFYKHDIQAPIQKVEAETEEPIEANDIDEAPKVRRGRPRNA